MEPFFALNYEESTNELQHVEGDILGKHTSGEKVPLMSFPSAALRANSAQDEREVRPCPCAR